MNKKYLIYIVILLSLAYIAYAETSYGPNYETSCQNNLCQTTIYSYEKYWFNENNQWEEIDENFFDCSENNVEKFCTNEYYFNVEADETGIVSALMNNEEFTVQMSGLLNNDLNFNPSIEGSVIIYEDVIQDYVDLRYQYLPQKLKEEIIIKQPLPNLPQEDFDITFAKSGNAAFGIHKSTICDANYICEFIPHQVSNDKITIQIPVDFLTNENIEYPITIDPTIELNDSYISWNGVIKNNTGTSKYVRESNPSTYLRLGNLPIMGGSKHSRGSIEWNISSIPDSSSVLWLNLSLFLATPSAGSQTVYLNITQLEGDSTTYEDNETACYGNCHFYMDMGNGSLYSEGTYQSENIVNISLSSQALEDFESSLTDDIFSTGLDGLYTAYKELRVYPRDNANATRRPKLVVAYGVNETDGNAAIEEGINNSLSNNPIQTDQQIYLVNENEEHYLGTFDKSTILGNQTWAFNYVIRGESFTNMPSLYTVLNVWENQSLTYNEIVEQVETFINSTKY